MEARAELVDLVEHHHATARAGLLERLDDVAGQRANVGTPVPAYLRLVVHTTERHAHELAPERLGDALAEGSLADSGRADKAQDGAVPFRVELAHREKFDDALFNLIEAEVVRVENAPRLPHVDRVGLGALPGQLDQPVEIGTHHGVLARGVGHALQALCFLRRLLLDFFGHAGLGDRFPELLDLGGLALLALAQFLLDRFHLLAQDVLALGLIQARLGALVDLA